MKRKLPAYKDRITENYYEFNVHDNMDEVPEEDRYESGLAELKKRIKNHHGANIKVESSILGGVDIWFIISGVMCKVRYPYGDDFGSILHPFMDNGCNKESDGE